MLPFPGSAAVVFGTTFRFVHILVTRFPFDTDENGRVIGYPLTVTKDYIKKSKTCLHAC